MLKKKKKGCNWQDFFPQCLPQSSVFNFLFQMPTAWLKFNTNVDYWKCASNSAWFIDPLQFYFYLLFFRIFSVWFCVWWKKYIPQMILNCKTNSEDMVKIVTSLFSSHDFNINLKITSLKRSVNPKMQLIHFIIFIVGSGHGHRLWSPRCVTYSVTLSKLFHLWNPGFLNR